MSNGDDDSDGGSRRKEFARRPAIDLGTSRGERASDELRPVIGKRTLVEELAAGHTALAAVGFFDRATGEIRAQLAALARALASGDRLLGVTAAGSLRASRASARAHIARMPGATAGERLPALAELERAVERALRDACDRGILPDGFADEMGVGASSVRHDGGARAGGARNGLDDPASDSRSAISIAARGIASSGGPLPFASELQASFGRHDLSGVRAHTDGAAGVAARTLGARAFAFGDDVAFAEPPDLRTAAHEAAHVIQQRRGIAREDAEHEQHADTVADAVVRGTSAEALLDEISAHGSSAAVVQRDTGRARDHRPPELYLSLHERALWTSVRQHLMQTSLPQPHARLAWNDEERFVDATVARLRAMDLFTGAAPLAEVLAPIDPYQLIERQIPPGRGWVPVIGTVLAVQFERAIAASLLRLGPRWIEIADRAGEAGPHDERSSRVTPEVLVASHPMDLAVRRGLTAGLVVDLAVPVGGRPKPTGRVPGLRSVRLEWQGARDPALWNWVRSVEPADASAEEVAAALWAPVHRNWDGSGSIYAHRLIAKPPLFSVPPALAATFVEARRHAPDTSHITAVATRIGKLMQDRGGGGWDREVITAFEQVPPAARVELQRRLDMPALLAAMGDFEASRLGTLGPVAAGREILNRKRAAYIKQAIDEYAPERAQVFILFVFRGVHDDDAYSIFAELANRGRISELLAMPELARVFKARGFKTDGFQEPTESWTNVFTGIGSGLRNAVKDPRTERYREQARQLPPEYYRALWDLEKADVERGLAPKDVVRSLADHITFGVPLGIVDLARGTARGIGGLVDGEYERAGHDLAGAALVVLAHLGVKAWHVARAAITATNRTAPRSGGQAGQGQTDPGHAGSSTTVRGPDGPGQFTLPNFQGPITAAEAKLGAIFAINPEAQAAMGRLISRIGTRGVERVAGFVQREHRAALFVAEHGEAAVYALLEAGGDVTAARTRLPSRQLAAAESAQSQPATAPPRDPQPAPRIAEPASPTPVAAASAAKPTRAQIEVDFATHAKNLPNEVPGAFAKARGKLDLGSATATLEAEAKDLYMTSFREAYFEAREARLTHSQAKDRARDVARKRVGARVRAEAETIAQQRARADLTRDTNADGVPDAFEVTDARMKQVLADYRSGARGAMGRSLAPLLRGGTLDEMERILAAQGGIRSPARRGATNIVAQGTHAYPQIEYSFADGTLVRLKPTGGVFGQGPMYSVEVQHGATSARVANPQDNIAFKLDPDGRPVPKGEPDIKNPYSTDQPVQRTAYRDEMIGHGHLEAKKEP